MKAKSLVSIITLGCCLAYAQDSPHPFLKRSRQAYPGKTMQPSAVVIDRKPGEIVSVQTRKDGDTRITKVDLAEVVNLIVEMKDRPLFIQDREASHSALQKSAYVNRLAQFRSDLGALHRMTSTGLNTTLALPVVKREFYKIFVGAAITVPRAMVSRIASLDYVKKIHADGRVKALSEPNVHQIRADSVWSKLGNQGDSVVVGIIDTGIDYLDSLLGGGFGPGYKVIGGYDYYNGDADPMDDNGHGTHVAGIVAAHGDILQGVAPHAKLMAFKVLSGGGYGMDSDVLAGIEGAADPNDDGNTDDKVDVVNMSLGGTGSPDDALSTAVDNAVSLGITFCIAAGNAGGFYTIGSPGTARRAITVGAVDSTDQIAFFSSKGPNPLIYSIKPEVVAPGVDIRSTLPGNAFGKMSGTSMATPHVAGVCALLKSLHRDWTPSQIKSAVTTTALDLGQEVMAQGSGRIDALKAAEATAFIIPSQIGFGLDSFAPLWTKTDTVWVTNRSITSQSFTLLCSNPGPGISFDITPSTFSLSPSESQQVVITISVDNARVPSPTAGSLAYSGMARLCSAKDTLHIPWAFIKAAKMSIAFDQPYADFVLSNSRCVFESSQAFWPDSCHAEFIAPPGVYDLFASFFGSPNKCVIKEGINLDTSTSLSVPSADAIYSVSLNGVDENGQQFPSSDYEQVVYGFIFPDSSLLRSWNFLGAFDTTMLVSGFSSRFRLNCGESTMRPPNIYGINFNAIKGLQSDMPLSNRPGEFHAQHLVAKFPPRPQYNGISVVLWSKIVLEGGLFYFGISGADFTDFTGNWHGNIYFTTQKDSTYGTPISVMAYDQQSPYIGPCIWSAPFVVVNDSVAMSYDTKASRSLYLSPNNGSITLGQGLHYTIARSSNNLNGNSNIAAFPGFFGAMDEDKYTTHFRSQYTISSSGGVIASDTLANLEPIDVPAGEYKLEVKHQDYFIQGVQGLATLTERFDLRKADANPPTLTSLRLLNHSGTATDTLSLGEHGTLVFSAIDINYASGSGTFLGNYGPINIDSTKLYFRRNGTPAWHSLAIERWMTDTADVASPRGFVFKADITDAVQVDSTGIDIKIALQDPSGNTAEWSLEPAFGVGKFGIINAIPGETTLPVPATFALRQNYPNPFNPATTIEFDLPRRSFVTLEVFNLLGQRIATILAEDMQAGAYKIQWHAGNVASGIYFYRLHAGSFTGTKKLLLLR
jgi:hypothetical protein